MTQWVLNSTVVKTIIVIVLSLTTAYRAYAIDYMSMKVPQIQAIKLVSFSATQHQASFDVTVFNPNEHKIPVREMTGDILLNDQVVAQLEANSKKSLAPKTSQIFTVPITVIAEPLVATSQQALLSGQAYYAFNGYIMTPVGELPIHHSGQLTAEQLLILIQKVLLPELTQ